MIEVKYKEYIVAFLDVLGFKKIIQGENSEQETSRFFNNGRVLKEFMTNFRSGFDGIELISDSIIAYRKLGCSALENDRMTQDFLRNICSIQFHLMDTNHPVRGGISVGALYVNLEERIITGPAFIDAFELECKNANVPRIVVNQKVIDLISNEQEIVVAPEAHGVPSVRRDSSFIINFLNVFDLSDELTRPTNSVGTPPRENANTFLRNIRRTIERGFQQTEQNEKYSWLLAYCLWHIRRRIQTSTQRDFWQAQLLAFQGIIVPKRYLFRRGLDQIVRLKNSITGRSKF
ncbi:MAG: hypothetical protein HYW48_08745 [Deltaproteobacteria bacterium]|nr:hypothetical protein [Deltaproteobacteria bacterium]